MTKETDEEGLVVHILKTGLTYPVSGGEFGMRSEIGYRGQTLRLSAKDVEVSRNRAGTSFWTLSPAEQFERWGEQRFGMGEFPADEPRFIRGSVEWLDARDDAARAAAHIRNDDERRAAQVRVREQFGPGPKTSHTIATYPSDEEIRAAREARGEW